MPRDNHELRVRVLLFAQLAYDVQQRELVLELPGGATVADALQKLSQAHAPIARWRDRLAVAVNAQYTNPTCVLSDGDELALIPPVTGG